MKNLGNHIKHMCCAKCSLDQGVGLGSVLDRVSVQTHKYLAQIFGTAWMFVFFYYKAKKSLTDDS